MKKLLMYFAILVIVLSGCNSADDTTTTAKKNEEGNNSASEKQDDPQEISGEFDEFYDLIVYEHSSSEIKEKISVKLSNPHVDTTLPSNSDSINEEYDYLIIDIAVENIGETETISTRVGHASLTAYNENGVEITTIGGESEADNYNIYQSGSLRPGGKNEGTLIKWIKEGEAPSEIIFESDIWGNGDSILFKMN